MPSRSPRSSPSAAALRQRRYQARFTPAERSAIQRRHKLKQRYGITPEEFDAMLLAQGNCCAVCKSPDPRHSRGWRVDHNHQTGKIRGVVCNPCNVAIGMAHEDPGVMFQIAVYLKAHET